MKSELEERKVASMKADRAFDLSRNICLVPQFSEKEFDVFFLSFEKLAEFALTTR